jgi:hypothetical protein
MSEDTIEIKTIIQKSPDGSNWGTQPPDWVPFHPFEGFWWSPDEVVAKSSRKGWLRALLEKKSLHPDEDVNEIVNLGRKDIATA